MICNYQRWAKGPIDRSSDTDSIFRLYRMIQSVDAKFRFLNRPIVSVRFEFRFFNRPILFFGFFKGNFLICNCSYLYALFASHHHFSLKTTPVSLIRY
jgi:hypothetical protein